MAKTYEDTTGRVDASDIAAEPLAVNYVASKALHSRQSKNREQNARAFAESFFSAEDVEELAASDFFVSSPPQETPMPETAAEWETLIQECDKDCAAPSHIAKAFWNKLSGLWTEKEKAYV
ncbi:MAG: hypothetical protein K5778_07545 [Bacteroidaceae bacterium]|nr:hypothetical protein [Bacteroidaceae bacterium]